MKKYIHCLKLLVTGGYKVIKVVIFGNNVKNNLTEILKGIQEIGTAINLLLK